MGRIHMILSMIIRTTSNLLNITEKEFENSDEQTESHSSETISDKINNKKQANIGNKFEKSQYG